MRGLRRLTVVQAKLFLREPAAFFFTLVLPIVLLLVFGSIFGNEPNPTFNPNAGYIDQAVPGLAAMIIATLGLIGLPINLATAREMGVLRRFHATPIRPWVIIASDILVGFAMALVGMALLVVAASVLYRLQFPDSWWKVLTGFVLGAFSFFALGYVIASLSPTPRVAQTVGMALFFPMLFFSGAAMPRAIMPETVQQLSEFLPMTHVVDLLQGLWFDASWSTHLLELAVLLGLLIAGAAISARAFRWE